LRAASADLSFAYEIWIDRFERNAAREPQFRTLMNGWTEKPQFSIVLFGPGRAPAQLERSRQSIARQIYPFCTLMDGSNTSPIAAADGDYIVPLRAGDALSESALFRFAEALQAEPKAAILYGDHDHSDQRGRRTRPWFKPDWNEELFLAKDYLSGAMAIERTLAQRTAKELGSAADELSVFTLAVTATGKPIVHVPHIVTHVHTSAENDDERSRMAAVAQQLMPFGGNCFPGPFGTIKVQWPLPTDLPLVSIIVPTRDKLELLRPCLKSVLGKTDYRNFEVLVIDNESAEQRTADYLTEVARDPRVRVIRLAGAYNFSSFNNFAVGQVRGSYLCLLNNDTEVVEPAWLSEMVRYAVRPEAGAVGAKLLYDDGTIQHAGVVIGLGEAAGHAHRFLPADVPGYFCLPHVAHFASAVTAACLVVNKAKFEAVGGLDESLAVAFNDVDLCLKLQAAGFRNVYVPHAVLLHHESKSRGNDMSPQHLERYRRELRLLQNRWGTKTYNDPLHNPNLDRYSETYVVRI
jgi:GT2 family glycosyltransferase